MVGQSVRAWLRSSQLISSTPVSNSCARADDGTGQRVRTKGRAVRLLGLCNADAQEKGPITHTHAHSCNLRASS